MDDDTNQAGIFELVKFNGIWGGERRGDQVKRNDSEATDMTDM